MQKIFPFILAWLIPVIGFSQTESKRKKIEILLNESGAAEMGVQAVANMSASFKKVYPDVPSGFWDEFLKEVKASDLTDLIVPIYNKYYSESDIEELIVFYKTPIGKKMISVLPQLTTESMMAGQEWGRKIAEKAMEKIKEKGLDK